MMRPDMGPTLDLFGDDDTAQSGREMLGEQSVAVSYTHLTLPTKA